MVNAGLVEESGVNEWVIVGKSYVIYFDPSNNSYYCKNCKGWLNCHGKATEKTCKHVEAVKIFRGQKN